MANSSERTPGGRQFSARWLPVLAYVVLVFTLSAQPGLHVPKEFEYGDKLAHVFEYGGLGWLGYRAARESWPRVAFVRRALLVIAVLSALGACDEVFQSGIPGRDSNAYDWSADTLGASLAQLLGLALDKRRRAV